jgi:F0F1-type ATP synthase assembly protein I
MEAVGRDSSPLPALVFVSTPHTRLAPWAALFRRFAATPSASRLYLPLCAAPSASRLQLAALRAFTIRRRIFLHARLNFMAETPDPNKNQNKNKNESPWVQFGRYSQLAFMLPAGTVAGYLIGALLDRWLHTTWISIVGLLLGTAGALVELIRTISRDTQ